MSLRPQSQIHQATNSPRALQSLREKHVAEILRALAHERGKWQLDRHEGYDGDLTALITSAAPQAEDYERRLCLVVHRSLDGFHLATSRGDDYEKLGCFAALEELIATMRDITSPLGGDAGPRFPDDQASANSRRSRAIIG